MPTWAYIIAVLVFGLLVLAHEAGHFLMARARGIAVVEFSVGFGPRLIAWRRAGTTWTVRALPLGGYVRWAEEGAGAFAAAPAASRALALLGGPLANAMLALVLLVALLGPVRGHGWESLGMALQALGSLTTGWVAGMAGLMRTGIAEMSGPVGITRVTAEVVTYGLDRFLLFTAFLSLNLGLLNLLPLPGLDGGRLLFIVLERLRRRPVDPLVEGWIHATGFLLFLGLILATVVKDLVA